MSMGILGVNWIEYGFVTLFLWFDNLIYELVAAMYSVFLAVSNIDIFGTGGIGEGIFAQISRRIYTVISIVMVFVFAYYLIMLIINPDGNDKLKSTGNLVKETLLSVVMVALLPLVFEYMFTFQHHVLTNQTIPAIILGTNATDDEGASGGSTIARMIFMSMYYPVGTNYSTFINENGELRDDALSLCTATADEDVCKEYISAVAINLSNTNVITNSVVPFTASSIMRKAINEEKGMVYFQLFSSIIGLIVAWFFISYSIDLGTRAVKLAFLQLVAPIPVILRIFQKAMFDKWYRELFKTYVEVFIRVAVILFAVYICRLVPLLVVAIWESPGQYNNGILHAAATVILILGILKFAKDAPTLVKNVFSGGGMGLFEGLNLKPGVRKHIEDNTYAMKGISTGVAAGASMIGNGVKAWNDYKNNNGGNGEALGEGGETTTGGAIGHAIPAALRGVVSGGRYGATNSLNSLGGDDLRNLTTNAIESAHSEEDNHQNNPGAIRSAVNQYNTTMNSNDGTRTEAIRNAGKEFVDQFFDVSGKKDKIKQMGKLLNGDNSQSNLTLQTAKGTGEMFNQIMSRTDKSVESIKEAYNAALKDLQTKGEAKFMGQDFKGDNATEIQQAIKAMKHQSDLLQTGMKRDALNKDGVREASKTQLANIYEFLKKNGGGLGKQGLDALQETIRKNMGTDADGKEYNLDSFMKKVTDLNAKFDAKDIKTIAELQTTLKNQEKNIITAQQVEQTKAKTEKKDNK